MNPENILVTLKPMGMFMVKLNIALVGGAVLALPWLLYQVWTFIAPGLFSSERRNVSFIIVSFTFCFAIGSSVAYFGVIPLSLHFLVGLTDDTDVVAQFDIGMYISFVLRLLIAFGAVFELPVATFFLAKVGVLTSSAMRSGRRYAILVGFVLAAFLTPPDPISQMMMALPLIFLYEISIWVARVAQPKA
jgi:sec-independent protein translocase protein TatC